MTVMTLYNYIYKISLYIIIIYVNTFVNKETICEFMFVNKETITYIIYLRNLLIHIIFDYVL